VKTASIDAGAEVLGFRDGFRGLVDDDAVWLTYDMVSNVLTQGGTLLGTTRDHFFAVPGNGADHSTSDRTQQAVEVFRKHQLDALVCVGGDGTLTVATALQQRGIPIVGIPKTIDNDVAGSDVAIGFDTAVWVAAASMDRLHSTAASHHRVMIVETMGRTAGWVALYAGVASGADVILIPEIPFTVDGILRVIHERMHRGRHFSIIALAEGAGHGEALAQEIERRSGQESRAVVLGHLQRGGGPTPADRLLATRLGYEASHVALAGRSGVAVCWNDCGVHEIPLVDIAGHRRLVDEHSALVKTARAVGTSFGE